MNDLAAMLGGAAAMPPMPGQPGPAPMGAPMGMDPMMGAPAPGPMPVDPMAAMSGMGATGTAPANPFPSTDPEVVGSLLEQFLMLQQSDQAALQDQQMMTLMGDPMFQALLNGSPVGPGAGQDAQAIGPVGDIAPTPMMP